MRRQCQLGMNDRPTHMHPAGRLSSKDSRIFTALVTRHLHPTHGVGELVHLLRQLFDPTFHLKDPSDAVEVNPLFLGQMLDHPQRSNVTHRVATPPPPSAFGHYKPEPIVSAQGLRVHSGELCRH